MDELVFANIRFTGLNKKSLLSTGEEMKVVVTVNAEFIVKANTDEEFKNIINKNIATFDGQIPYIIAKIKNPRVTFEKISGSELIYDICEKASTEAKKIYLLGGEKTSNELSQEILREKYRISIGGDSPEYKPYPFPDDHNKKIIEKIEEYRPGYLLVGFGAGKQEMWIEANRETLQNIGVEMVVGVGGTFEMVSGKLKRAPKIIQRLGLEGIYRLYKQPSVERIRRLMTSFKMFKYIFR